MKDHSPHKINNSYESLSSGSTTSSSSTGDVSAHRFMNLDFNHGFALSSLILSNVGSDYEIYNTSAEEGIFPNIRSTCPVAAPSYEPEYDYYNQYSTAPLVYSWMPIVPGFNPECADNLHKFDHLVRKVQPHPFTNSETEIAIDTSDNAIMPPALNDHDDSLLKNLQSSLSELRSPTSIFTLPHPGTSSEIEIAIDTSDNAIMPPSLNDQDDSLLIKLQSSLSEVRSPTSISSETEIAINTSNNTIVPTLKDQDDFLLKKFQSSLSEVRPPPSISTLPLSLSEMIAIYKRNLEKPKESFTTIQSNLMFVPSHPLNETKSMEWPKITEVKAHGIIYNRSTDCEQIEFMTVKYVERFIKAETTSSYNHKVGPSSAKKKIEKLKLLTQSPSSRLSHLANRRKIFSSANLKSSSTTTSHKSFATSKQLLVDKSKLYQKKKRASAKKKTPEKRKTPRSAKRQNLQSLLKKPESTASSKRALFISPMKTKNDTSTLSRLNRELPTRGQLPKRALFSPPQNAKRRRSPSPSDVENKYGKSRRLESPSKILKSKSFSIAPVSSSGSLDEHFRKTLYYRTQSEAVINQSIAGSSSNNTIGFRKSFTDTEKKKLLWTASSALQSKQVNRDHEKFKEYMSTLCKLVKKVFTEFYNPTKSMSAQMTKFSNLMVFYVVQGRSFDEIYLMTKNKLEAQNPTKVSGYIGQEDYQKNHFIRKNSSLLLMTNSCSSFSINSDSLEDSTFDKSGSETSLNRSTSKNSEKVLRENFSSNARDNSTKKLFSTSTESNLNTLKTSTPSSQVLKAKRQISF